MTFSIIIPVYNVAPYLRECLDSVLAQTHEDWEAICVDDGSTDGSGEILDEYAERDRRFCVVHTANAGVGAARNVALGRCNGGWICFLDADDLIASYLLSRVATVLSRHQTADFVAYKTEQFADGTAWRPICREALPRIKDLSNRLDSESIETCFCGGVYSGEVLGQSRFREGVRIGEDRIFYGECLGRCRTIVCLDEVCYGYRQRNGSATHAKVDSSYVIEETNCWVVRLRMLFGDGRDLACSTVRMYLLWVTEAFAWRLFDLQKSERDLAWKYWVSNALQLSQYGSKMPKWNAFVFGCLRAMPQQWLLFVMCYIPHWLKRKGLHR